MPENDESSTELDPAKIAAARLWACHKWPYLAEAMLAMQPVAAPGIGGFAVDEGWRVYLDPEAVDRWTPSQLGFVLNHEAQHLLRDHAGRARGFGVSFDERLAWNVAADAEINDDLASEISRADRKILEPLTPKHLDLEPGKLAEYYYTQVRESAPFIADEGSGVHGHSSTDESKGDAEAPAISQAEAEMLRQATADAIMAEQAGTAPEGLERWARARGGPSQDWRSLLASSIRHELARAAGLADYSYRRLSRRAGAVPDVVLPAMVKSQADVAIVIDTSGSIREQQLGDALRETRAIAQIANSHGGTVRVLACDAVVSRTSPTLADEMALTGGGGTDMREGIEAAMADEPRPKVIVVLTDGVTPWPETAPSIPVVIGLIGNKKAADTPDWATTIEVAAGE